MCWQSALGKEWVGFVYDICDDSKCDWELGVMEETSDIDETDGIVDDDNFFLNLITKASKIL